MNQLSTRFVFTNIFTALALIVSLVFFRNQEENFADQQNVGYGLLIYVVLLGGMYFSALKARSLGGNLKKKISAFEMFFLFCIYIFAVGGSVLLIFMANSILFGGFLNIPDYMSTIGIVTILLAFGFLVAEPFLFASLKKKTYSPRKMKIIDFAISTYVGIGVSVTWNTMVYDGQMHLDTSAHDFWSELFSSVVLCFMVVIPFQRLFWYEVMAESKRKDSWKVFGSLTVVVACAIIPLFWN